MSVVVHIDKFSGPMALLLHLIRREEMDIFDININAITKQYLESIRAMKKLNLETAGDFIAMASTLIQIKSSMLLPQYNDVGEVIEQDDPRRDLVRGLMEYQMYQDAGQNLYKRQLVGREVFVRGYREEIQAVEEGIVLEDGNALYSLIAAYRSAFKNMKRAVHKVTHSLQSIADRILEMRVKLVAGTTTKLSDLLLIQSKYTDRKGQLLITFLSLLELAKIGLVQVFQSENFADIHVETKKEINENSISNIENYDSQVNSRPFENEIVLNESEKSDAGNASDSEKYSGDGQLKLQTDQSIEVGSLASPFVAGEPSLHEEDIFVVQAATDEDIENEEKLYGKE